MSASAAPVAKASLTAPLSSKAAKDLSLNSTHKVIVVFKNQPKSAHVGSAAAKSRATHVRSLQKPLLSELGKVRAKHVKSYQTINSVAATVSSGELSRLRANPSVASVVPDSTIHLSSPAQPAASKPAAGGPLTPNVIPGACGKNGAVQLDPEALDTTHTDSDTANAQTARSLGYTGKGVKVAWIAEGIDPNNVNFIKPDGKSVFTDYQDFSGDGPNSVTDGAEAFLDANAIAGQGRHVYNVQNFSAQPDPTACNIRIEGTAPGVDLVGLKVFSNGITTESNFLQAINYAVQTDHVNVLNESFGGNPLPDTAADVTKQFDDAAVAAGVTVTVSSGDSGPFNSNGSPSTDPNLLAVGGSTTFRFLAQTNYELARDVATTGWLNNNISALSSGGVTESGRVLDLVAPGDLSFASCDASAKFEGCTNFLGQPSDVEESGGTSESAPLTAGIAALVIEAYRDGHGGATPTPAQVKKILTSSAEDLGAPATEQGAGQVNAYRAVQLARSLKTAKPTGDTIALSTDQIDATGKAGSTVKLPLTVTNEGARAQTVKLSGRTLGPDTNVQTGSVDLEDGTSPQTPNYQGLPVNYAIVHFTVKPNQDRLDVSLAYPGDPTLGNNQRIRFTAVDPKGRLAGHSFPQGVGNYGEFDVQHPTAGTWTGLIFGDAKSVNGTNGVVHYRTATQKYQAAGSLASGSGSFTLAPGQSHTVQGRATAPAKPGDMSGSIVVDSGPNAATRYTTTVSVAVRSLIDPATNGGKFSGTLTGGNGRPGAGQEQFYEFKVGKGVHDITANVRFPSDPSDPVAEYLISPDGDTLGYGQNALGGNSYNALTAYTLHPQQGTWTLIVDFAEPTAGDLISQPYTGDLHFDQTLATAKGLPNSKSTKLAAGKRVEVPVKITNTGKAPEEYFLDPRLNTTEVLPLAPLDANSGKLPLTNSEPYWFVPTETSSLRMDATGSKPIMFDYQPANGDPDIASASAGPSALCSTSPTSTYSPFGGQVTSGIWFGIPSECGPYTDAGEPAATYSMNATVATKTFDQTVTSSTGDLELTAQDASTTASPVALSPGQSVTVMVTITPTGTPGTEVQGQLFVDDVSDDVPPNGQFAGSEVTSLPYHYTIK
ncbi:S8 family serine peptidase [uncultured Jatrophihabitans sp.]|uniref:S8 family serine peptidase n=1 Tax=uncultured Jatrophihabitans sp. TaxID=1610747 RepID=UPI0035C9AAEC